jgi:hypothetical protein
MINQFRRCQQLFTQLSRLIERTSAAYQNLLSYKRKSVLFQYVRRFVTFFRYLAQAIFRINRDECHKFWFSKYVIASVAAHDYYCDVAGAC